MNPLRSGTEVLNYWSEGTGANNKGGNGPGARRLWNRAPMVLEAHAAGADFWDA